MICRTFHKTININSTSSYVLRQKMSNSSSIQINTPHQSTTFYSNKGNIIRSSDVSPSDRIDIEI